MWTNGNSGFGIAELLGVDVLVDILKLDVMALNPFGHVSKSSGLAKRILWGTSVRKKKQRLDRRGVKQMMDGWMFEGAYSV